MIWVDNPFGRGSRSYFARFCCFWGGETDEGRVIFQRRAGDGGRCALRERGIEAIVVLFLRGRRLLRCF